MKILNLTQHKASAEQLEVGVYDAPDALRSALGDLLTFGVLPRPCALKSRATALLELAKMAGDYSVVMIGGAPYFMPVLEREFLAAGYRVLYAFSERVSVERDGVKTSVFKHAGFYEAVSSDYFERKF